MKNLITRKEKKKIRAIILLHTGSPFYRKASFTKENWLYLRTEYKVWLGCFVMKDRVLANNVR